MNQYHQPLLPNHPYHLFSRAVGSEQLFLSEENYHFFLQKLKQHTSPVCRFYCYSLLPNHFQRFSNFLNSYTKAFNKVNKRKGALFMDYLKRSCVNNDRDFSNFVWYIHKNAVHHQLTKAIGEWRFDSYKTIISEEPTSLLRNELIEWFGGKDKFIEFHRQPI